MARKKPTPPAPDPFAPNQSDPDPMTEHVLAILPRNQNGAINNCALANGYPVTECQMCLGKCPDGPKFDPDGFPVIVPCTPSAARIIRGQKFAGIDLAAEGSERTVYVTADGTDRRRSVEAREVESRRVLTLDTTAPEWASALIDGGSGYWKGAIVRLRPPPDAPDELVEHVRKSCEKAGAERVVVLPRPRAHVVPGQVAASGERKRTTARQAVAELVGEANTKDREALGKLCDAVMGRNGL